MDVGMTNTPKYLNIWTFTIWTFWKPPIVQMVNVQMFR